METPLADVEQLQYRTGKTYSASELPGVEAVLDDVSALVRLEAGRTWIDPDTGEIAGVPSAIKTVVLRVAERVLSNPDNLRQESAGDYSYTYRDGDIYLSKNELRLVRRAVGLGQLWTQRVERDDPSDTTLWCEDNYGCELFPLTAEGD